VTLAQLEAFRLVARHGSFSRAARALGITQPAVSQQVAGLARELGLSLVDVRRNRPHLTEAGAFVAGHAERACREAALLKREAAAYAQGLRGALRVAATRTIGSYLLPALLARFLRDRPAVAAEVEIANTSLVEQRVADGDVALGLVEGRVTGDSLVCTPFARDRMVLVVPPRGHRFSGVAQVTAAQLAGEAFVIREQGSGTRNLGYDLLDARGVATHVVVELPSGEAIVRAVESGLGIAILSELVTERAARLGVVHTCTISDLPLERAFSLVRAKDRVLPPTAQEFAALVEAFDSRLKS
jgi:DNA-binding transcriptional LysR family regulator